MLCFLLHVVCMIVYVWVHMYVPLSIWRPLGLPTDPLPQSQICCCLEVCFIFRYVHMYT